MNYEKREYDKRDKELVLIASENYPSQAILDASGSIFQLKYAEGHVPDINGKSRRYYQGCEIVDEMEQDCIDKCLELFGAEEEYLANVQPNSGASANMVVYNAILEPGDTVVAMDVKAGGHISHSHPKSFLAKYHNVIPYGVDDNGMLDYDAIEDLCLNSRPKLIVVGASNYSLKIDFKRFREIADKCGSLLMTDIAHISLLVAHGEHPSPVGLADFITSTTHKCLKGPRGAFIIYKKEFDKEIRLSTIPGLFGGPLEHQIYAKLVCFNEALSMNSKQYAKQIIKNNQAMLKAYKENNIPVVSGNTENHLMTIDLTEFDISGRQLAVLLEECGIICNCNSVPNDKRSFMETSGVRLGTPAITTRGLDESDCYSLALNIANLINCFKINPESLESCKNTLKQYVANMVKMYPLSRIYTKFSN